VNPAVDAEGVEAAGDTLGVAAFAAGLAEPRTRSSIGDACCPGIS
jgi:hypothetical protein